MLNTTEEVLHDKGRPGYPGLFLPLSYILMETDRKENFMQNIWSYFTKDNKAFWCHKLVTLQFWRAISEGRKFIIFDLETTGLKKKADVIVEFSAIVMEKTGKFYEMTEAVEYYIKPPFQMNPEVIAIHGITNEFLSDKPTEAEAYPAIKAFFNRHKDGIISGYNVGFDCKFMEAYAARQKDVFSPGEVIDMFDMVKENIFQNEHEGCRKLSHILSVLYPSKQYNFHNASDDILATWDVGKGILQNYVKSQPTLEGSKPCGKLSSYQYWAMGKTQRLYCTISVNGKYYDIYYDIYQSCWVCELDKNEANVFTLVNMEDIEDQFTKIAAQKGKKKFRLLRDSDNWKNWKTAV